MAKRHSSDLFMLIQCMSPWEKRHFKSSLLKEGGRKSDFFSLFNFLEKEKKFDEKKLLKQGMDRLPLLKNRLYELLLKNLYEFHSEKSIENHLRSLAGKFEILVDKGLYAQARKVLQKAQEMARQYEKDWFIIYFMLMEIELSKRNDYQDPSQQKAAFFYKSIKKLLKSFLNEMDYGELRSQAVEIYISGRGNIGPRITSLMQSDLLKDQTNALTNNSKEHFLHLNSIYYSKIKQDYKRAFSFTYKLLALMKSRQAVIEEDPVRYSQYLQNHINFSLELNWLKDIPEVIDQLRKIIFKTAGDWAQINAITNNIELSYFSKLNKDSSSNFKLLKNHKRFLVENSALIRPETFVFYHSNAAYIYFSHKDYLKCNKEINELFNNTALSNKQVNLHAEVHALKLLVHYELGKYELIEYHAKNTYEFFKKNKLLSPFYESFLKFFRYQFKNLHDKASIVKGFGALKKDLEKIKTETADSNGARILSWLESTMNGHRQSLGKFMRFEKTYPGLNS